MTDWAIVRLDGSHVADMRALNALFAAAFDDAGSYAASPPDDDYLADLLRREDVVALVARDGAAVVGGLVAYVLPKLEQTRSEVYIYDLAVAEHARRRGIARALIDALKPIARAAGAWVIYVQADHGDDAAIALYDGMGIREEVLHFDIGVES